MSRKARSLLKIVKIIIIIAALGVSARYACAQDSLFGGKRNKLGLIAGYGFQEAEVFEATISLGVEYYYEVYFFALQGYRNVFQKKSFGIDLLLQPQYNLTNYVFDVKWIPGMRTGYEFGVNFGAVFRENLKNDLMSFYLSLSIGPHYISGELNRQASGFIFSDNIDLGANLKVYKSLYLDVRFGIRHISPAGLTQPDSGINTLMIYGGGFYSF
jgi:hypothetical protein